MNVTVEPGELPDKYLASSSPPKVDDIVVNKLKTYGDLLGIETPTVQMPIQEHIDSFVQQIANEIPCRRILVIRIGDSVHAGDGILFNVQEDDSVVRVEKWSGYEGAKGADVRGYFKEEYRITGSYEDIY
jgi:hypothetical protein